MLPLFFPLETLTMASGLFQYAWLLIAIPGGMALVAHPRSTAQAHNQPSVLHAAVHSVE